MCSDISETRAVSAARAEVHQGLDTVDPVAIVVTVVVAATIVSPALTTVVGLLAATVLQPVVITYAVVMSVAGAS